MCYTCSRKIRMLKCNITTKGMKGKRKPFVCVMSNLLSDFIYMSKSFLVHIDKYKINLHIKYALKSNLHTFFSSSFYKLITLRLIWNSGRSCELDLSSRDLKGRSSSFSLISC